MCLMLMDTLYSKVIMKLDNWGARGVNMIKPEMMTLQNSPFWNSRNLNKLYLKIMLSFTNR